MNDATSFTAANGENQFIPFYSENLKTELTQRKHDFYSVISLQIQEKARGSGCEGLGEGCRLSHAGELL